MYGESVPINTTNQGLELHSTPPIKEPKKTRGDYRPAFTYIYTAFKEFFKSHCKTITLITGESVTESPALYVNSFNSRTQNTDIEYVNSGLSENQGSLTLVLYTPEADLEKNYDIIANVLHGFASEVGLIGLEFTDRNIYNVPENINILRVFLSASFMYRCYTADTSYPVIEEEKCTSPEQCVNLLVKKVEVGS